MWTQYNPRVPLGVIAMISKGSYFHKLQSIIVVRAFLYLNPQCMLFWVSTGHTFIKVTETIKLVYEIDVVCDHLKHTKNLLVELYIHLNQCAKLLLLKRLKANFKTHLSSALSWKWVVRVNRGFVLIGSLNNSRYYAKI